MSHLFTPIRLREVECRNRIFVSPMCQYSCEDGLANDWHLVHLGSRAIGGAGLVMVEATAVSPEGRISPQDAGLWNDAQTDAFRRIAGFLKAHGAVPAIQLAHAGRKASTAQPWAGGQPLADGQGGWTPSGPSPLPFAPAHPVPHELTSAEIDDIVDCFVAATRRARAAGFDVVELHMAHGYLLHEFLSPLSNRRSDAYGGPLEHRMRLPLKVAAAVREVWPAHLPLLVRLSATDWVEGGWDVEQSVSLCRRLKALGIDMVDCSSGGLVANARIPAGPGFQVPFAARIRAETQLPTCAVGFLTEPEQAEQVLALGQADAVMLGRASLRDPYWPLHAATRLRADVAWPQQYERARPA